MKREPEAQVITRVWGNALPENFEMHRHGSATLRFIDILSKVHVNVNYYSPS